MTISPRLSAAHPRPAAGIPARDALALPYRRASRCRAVSEPAPSYRRAVATLAAAGRNKMARPGVSSTLIKQRNKRN